MIWDIWKIQKPFRIPTNIWKVQGQLGALMHDWISEDPPCPLLREGGGGGGGGGPLARERFEVLSENFFESDFFFSLQ